MSRKQIRVCDRCGVEIEERAPRDWMVVKVQPVGKTEQHMDLCTKPRVNRGRRVEPCAPKVLRALGLT
jgi:hypothetical protein